MKKEYVTPTMVGERFSADEYVAACITGTIQCVYPGTEWAKGDNGMPDIQAGDVTLTGSQALAHARNRTLGNDFERTRRQRSVMYGIYRKIMEKKDPSALLPLINYAVNHVRTNMSVSEMYSMAKDVLSVDDLKMQQTCIPQDGTYTDITYEGMQVLKVDFDANKKKIEQLLY